MKNNLHDHWYCLCQFILKAVPFVMTPFLFLLLIKIRIQSDTFFVDEVLVPVKDNEDLYC